MWNVAHFIALTKADDLREVVLHDPEMIAVILDVRRKNQCVPPSEDQLLAVVRRAPVDFQRDLICLHHFGRIREPLADLREKGEGSERGRRVVGQSGVRQLPRAPFRGAGHQFRDPGVVPVLRAQRAGQT